MKVDFRTSLPGVRSHVAPIRGATGAPSRLFALACALLLGSCGGGDDSESPAAPTGADGLARAMATKRPAGATWSALIPLSLVAASASNLPNGKVMLWSADLPYQFGGSGRTYTSVFDPVTSTVADMLVTQTNHDMFCPGTTNLADGTLLVNGGDDSTRTSLYSAFTNTWTQAAQMNIGRAYQGNALLEDGRALTYGGSWNGAATPHKHAEVWTAADGWKTVPGITTWAAIAPDPAGVYRGDNHYWLYPAPNGQVLHAGPGFDMHWLDTRGDGAVTIAGRRADDAYSMNGNAVMYDIGKILKVGGGPAYENTSATNSAYVLDVNAGVSVRKVASMAYPRMFNNSVVLPNGQVVVVGGQTWGKIFSDDGSVLAAELWDPSTETFTTLSPMAVGRNYHGVALLLPDARVMVGGSGLCGAGCAANHADLQILTPHYLIAEDGSPAVRPVIATAPIAASHGTTINVTATAGVTAFSLVRMSSATHSVNNDQRRVPLASTAVSAGNYSLTIPSNPGVVIPGYYMLFAMNAEGVPSLSKAIQITNSGAPKLTNPGTKTSTVAAATQLQVSATASSGALTFSATGLPPGLQINSATGLISGSATTPGRYHATLMVTDARASTSTQFQWSIVAVNTERTTRFVKLEALSETAGMPYTSMAEFNVLDASGAVISRTGWSVLADREDKSGESEARLAIDGNPNTFWHTQTFPEQPPPPHWFAVDMGVTRTIGGFKYLPRPGGSNGTVAAWRFHTSPDGVNWTVVGEGNFNTIADRAAEKIVMLDDAVPGQNQPPALGVVATQIATVGLSTQLQLSATDPNGDTLAYSAWGLPAGLGVSAASGLVSGTPTMAGTFPVTVTVSDGHGGSASRSFSWSVAAVGGSGGAVQYVSLVAVSEVNGGPWTSVADFNLLDTTGALISRSGWMATADSSEMSGENAPASNAIDDNIYTIWHTQWQGGNAPLPHRLTVNLGTPRNVGAFKMRPRAGGGNGTIAGWRFYTSVDGVTWALASQGTFANDGNEKTAVVTGGGTTLPPVNAAPVLAPVANRTDNVGAAVTLALTASDANGDTLSWAATGLPAGLAIGPATGLVTGAPTATGVYGATFTVSDGKGGSASRTMTWTVTRVVVTPPLNQPPTIPAIANRTDTVGVALAPSLALQGSDPDGDVLAWTATGLPPGLAIGGATGLVSGTPTTAGTFAVTVTVNDGRTGTASRSFSWQVNAPMSSGNAVRYVRLEAVTEVNGNPWTAMAEFNVLDAAGAVIPRDGWSVSADSAETVGENGAGSRAIDGDIYSIWHTQWLGANPAPPHTFTVNLGADRTVGGFRVLPRPAGTNGNIATWRFYTSANGVGWNLAAQGSFANNNLEKTVFPIGAPAANQPPTLAAVANQSGMAGQAVSLALTGSDGDGDVLVYSAVGLPPGISINTATGLMSGTPTTLGGYAVAAQVADARGGNASRSFTWAVTAPAGSGGALTAQYVRLEAVTEANGNPWTAVAEFNLIDPDGNTLSRTGWTATADSEELVGEIAPASRAIDGDIHTFWHTQWQGGSPVPPHTLTVNLGTARTIAGFRYLPRAGGGNGTIGGWRFYTSTNGTAWTLRGQGTFVNDGSAKTVTLQ